MRAQGLARLVFEQTAQLSGAEPHLGRQIRQAYRFTRMLLDKPTEIGNRVRRQDRGRRV